MPARKQPWPEAKTPGRADGRERDPLIYVLDWVKDEQLDEWRAVLRDLDVLKVALQATLALDAWNDLAVL
ncbi:DUF1612 domain-containing protein [Rhizobium leguminosarum]|uniref:DUF1612 domain-containing protein n=2 Tax=Rhizobium leguminosarum TaxID=384 RepID=A0A154IQN8_RHILE|nr:hypothetical protein A4A59_36255 [Rhizobium leguminosarum]